MDLKPFYELRERLKSGAVAGAGLAAEDFRLARAAEEMAPLAAASPVFGKLAALVRHLLSEECTDRAGALLDAVTLADAVLCTQGAVAPEGEVRPLTPIGGAMAAANVPYSVLAPLLEALTSSGSGKYSFVINTHKEQPELFKNYRVQAAMVDALGASYSELADQVESWLSAEGPSILPLLRHGFDPAGKRDMVRRVRVIEAVSGADANEYYLSWLPEAEKEVRQELIYALRYSGDNASRLIELCRTEKGGCKKAAHWALAAMEAPEAWEYWETLAAKKPDQAAEYMALSKAEGASVLTARLLDRWLEPFEADAAAPFTRAAADSLQALLAALPGKCGPRICDIYRRMASLGTALDRPLDDGREKEAAAFVCWYGVHQQVAPRQVVPRQAVPQPFSQALPMILKQALIVHPAPGLLALAKELGTGEESRQENFASAGIMASLISEPADQALLGVQPYLTPKGIFKKTVKKENLAVLMDGLTALAWDEDRKTQVYEVKWTDPVNGRLRSIVCPLREPLDRGWYPLLMAAGSQETDACLASVLCPDDREACALAGEYLYKKALTVSDSRPYLAYLRRCGWTDCENLAVRYCMRRGRVSHWELFGFIYDMPGDNQARAQEAERVLALIEKGRVKCDNSNPAALRQVIMNLRNTGSIVPLS